MELDDRLYTLQRSQRLRSELQGLRATLATLQESAWAESEPADLNPAGLKLSITSPGSSDMGALAELINAAYGQTKIEATEMSRWLEAGEVLICSGGLDGALPQLMGCCVATATASSLASCDDGAVGTVSVLAVRPDFRRQGAATRLLAAAEEQLAARHQCSKVHIFLETGCSPADSAGIQRWLQQLGYETEGDTCSGKLLLKNLALGFISRSLARNLVGRQASLEAELADLERVQLQGTTGTQDISVEICEDAVQDGILLSMMPHDVCAGVARVLSVRDLGALAPTCRILAQEVGDAELWRELFVRACWPQSEVLLTFAESSNTSAGSLDWCKIMRDRAEAPPAIVVDVGRGYTKYGVIHGLSGRPGGDGQPPRIVQLCSSPTHPPDCDHGDQMSFISQELDRSLATAIADPEHPLHRVALCGKLPAAKSGGLAVVHGLQARPELNGCVVRLKSFNDERGRWEATVRPGLKVDRFSSAVPLASDGSSTCADTAQGPAVVPSGPEVVPSQSVSDCAMPQHQVDNEHARSGALNPEREHGDSSCSKSRGSSPSTDPDEEILDEGSPAQPHRSPVFASQQAPTLLLDVKNLMPTRMARDLPIIVGEPFAYTASRANQPGLRQPGMQASHWASAIEGELRKPPGQLRIVPQANMALWAHGIDHGIVVNIGQGQTIALPVICGEVQANASQVSNMGSGALTQTMLSLLSQRFQGIDSRLMTWCRDLKENLCYVAPPPPQGEAAPLSLRRRLALGDTFGVTSVPIMTPGAGGEPFSLGVERVLVPEILFEQGGRPGTQSLQELIVSCAESVLDLGLCSQEAVQALLRNIVLVGGAADLPGIRPRTEYEVRALVRHRASPRLRDVLKSPDDVFVLNPPLCASGPLTSPRFVPFIGGCVRAASSGFFKGGGEAVEGLRAHPPALATHGAASHPDIAAWVRHRLFNLNAPAVFRTGGGGGEDEVWGRIGWRQRLGDMDESELASEDEDIGESGQDEDDMAYDMDVEDTQELPSIAPEQPQVPSSGQGGPGDHMFASFRQLGEE